jgi:regulator of protease activity HflC (stomatin/prohibitin superfamily)
MKSIRGGNPVAALLALLAALFALLSIWLALLYASIFVASAVFFVLLAILIPNALFIANQWEKAVVLRLGKLQAVRGPGLFLIIPFVDAVAAWIDQRIQTTEFTAEQALTRDTVPVNVDAIIFWQVHDAERAALEITDYQQAIARVAQTSLREMIGSTPLSALLSERRAADQQLKTEIGRKTADWGVAVISVEIRDVAIPPALQDAMSRQAQAEREREARVILGDSERQIAQRFVEAADIYAKSPAALQLRAMNIIYETTKERGATILMPTSLVDSMSGASVVGIATAIAKAESNA